MTKANKNQKEKQKMEKQKKVKKIKKAKIEKKDFDTLKDYDKMLREKIETLLTAYSQFLEAQDGLNKDIQNKKKDV